jgi:hypothetical protein
MRRLLSPLAVFATCAFALTAQAAQRDESAGPARMERTQYWAGDHEAVLDAELAGLKAGLRLTPDQDKLWEPFEAAVRDADKMRMEHFHAMMDRMEKMREMMDHKEYAEEAFSPIDRLEAVAKRMSERGAALEKIADAAKPLYASLDDSQKRHFGMLGREFFMMGHGHHGMGMMGGGMGMMDHGGTMGREPHGMMGNETDGEGSDDE